MVKYLRYNLYNHWKKRKEYVVDDDEDSYFHSFGAICGNSGYSNKKPNPKILYFILLSLISCCLILAPQILSSNSTFSLLYPFGVDDEGLGSVTDGNAFLCSSVPNGTICCDRSSIRSDICIMKGDVRTHSASSSVFLYRNNGLSDFVSAPSIDESDELEVIQHEKIKPYSRKWETSVMDTIDELNLNVKGKESSIHYRCDVQHNVPAVFFSTGGYTGNLYHELMMGFCLCSLLLGV
ncbi:Glycosyltransferase family 61 protein [Abeliophyllum distichum]|uniref:Glycosyltransferase family 61 protein n=1 Tax=Abeliophyllum distichum TaxID=126358 RepID=A0ABD1R0F3_9LAMI